MDRLLTVTSKSGAGTALARTRHSRGLDPEPPIERVLRAQCLIARTKMIQARRQMLYLGAQQGDASRKFLICLCTTLAHKLHCPRTPALTGNSHPL